MAPDEFFRRERAVRWKRSEGWATVYIPPAAIRSCPAKEAPGTPQRHCLHLLTSLKSRQPLPFFQTHMQQFDLDQRRFSVLAFLTLFSKQANLRSTKGMVVMISSSQSQRKSNHLSIEGQEREKKKKQEGNASLLRLIYPLAQG